MGRPLQDVERDGGAGNGRRRFWRFSGDIGFYLLCGGIVPERERGHG
jgi:hypothetical protein